MNFSLKVQVDVQSDIYCSNEHAMSSRHFSISDTIEIRTLKSFLKCFFTDNTHFISCSNYIVN